PASFDLGLPEKEPADEPDGLPFVTCRGWVVADAASGEVIGGDNLDTHLENASTTKLMTAWLVLRLAAEDPSVLEETAGVSQRAADTPGSTAKLEAGERLSVKDLLYGLLLPSGNDASVVIAEHFGGRFAPPEDHAAGASGLKTRTTVGSAGASPSHQPRGASPRLESDGGGVVTEPDASALRLMASTAVGTGGTDLEVRPTVRAHQPRGASPRFE